MAEGVRVQMISPDEVTARLSTSPDVLILDVRSEEEWAVHHLQGATLIPMHALRARLAELEPTRETIVVCEHGSRSLSVAQFLVTQAGFVNVASMNGGMSEWVGPVVRGA